MAEETKIDICIKIWKSGFHTFLDAYNLVYQQPLPSAPFITYYTTYVCSLTHYAIPFPLTSQLYVRRTLDHGPHLSSLSDFVSLV